MDPKQAAGPGAVIVSTDDMTRILIRALLRLQHIHVTGEADSVAETIGLITVTRPQFLVAGENLAGGSLAGLISEARSVLPSLRVILVGSASRPPALSLKANERPDMILLRPFRIRQFVEALGPAPSVGHSSPS